MATNYASDVEALNDLVRKYGSLRKEIGKVIIGQDEVVRDVLISIFSQGHCLLVGVPGLAKTLLVNTIARVLGLNYNRFNSHPI
jgi:MoxR-like ATPase